MAAKHTPGPWRVNGSAVETEETTIAHIYDPDENGPDEYTANARLIAAAPELLDMLGRLVHMAEYNTVPGPNTLAQARALLSSLEAR